MTPSRIRKVISAAGIKSASEINIENVEGALQEMLLGSEIGHKTYNHYVQALHQLCRWLMAAERSILQSNPLEGMERLNTEVDIRHPRRALTSIEFNRLVESAIQSGITIQCYDGNARARIYLISYFTGLRRNEIASLTPSSFDLNSAPPTLTLQAGSSKHRRKDVLPVHPGLVMILRDWLNVKPADEILFPHLAKRRTWLMVKRDLARVGIPYQTKEGIADFHAAGRHTHITELLRNGATLAETMELARHTDVRMTMKYTHIGIEDQAKALNGLPTPSRDVWQRIGSAFSGMDSHKQTQIDTKSAPGTNRSADVKSLECSGFVSIWQPEPRIDTIYVDSVCRVRFPPPPICKPFELHYLWAVAGLSACALTGKNNSSMRAMVLSFIVWINVGSALYP